MPDIDARAVLIHPALAELWVSVKVGGILLPGGCWFIRAIVRPELVPASMVTISSVQLVESRALHSTRVD
jgi:hypothetical protein